MFFNLLDCLALVFHHLLLIRAPVSTALDVLERIEARLPTVMRLWENSPQKDWMDENLPRLQRARSIIRNGLASGEVQMESPVTDIMKVEFVPVAAEF